MEILWKLGEITVFFAVKLVKFYGNGIYYFQVWNNKNVFIISISVIFYEKQNAKKPLGLCYV